MFGRESRDRDDRSRTFFEFAYRTYLDAEQSVGGVVDRYYVIAGLTLRLRFAGSALVPHITPAFAHLSSPVNFNPALTVCLWDSASTHTPIIPLRWKNHDIIFHEKRQIYYDDQVRVSFQNESSSISLLNKILSTALFWVEDADRVPTDESAAPLRTILHWVTSGHGLQMAHSAAIGTDLGGVLLAGKGGIGKSTTALACLIAGMQYVGDDYVVIGTDPVPFVHSLYNSAKLEPDQTRRFPELWPETADSRQIIGEKALTFVYQIYPERVKPGFPVRAILIPQVTYGSTTKMVKTSGAAALAAIAPSTIFQLPGAGRESLHALSEFVRRVPCYKLELGKDVSQISSMLWQFFQD
jgi:hypothetical protein